ncbi:hypothetical protein [Escherichia coli]|nr:hypothetical protein [Escherichia coli]
MQDLKIEYQDGKLVELSIDGMSFLHPPYPSVIQQKRRYQRSS